MDKLTKFLDRLIIKWLGEADEQEDLSIKAQFANSAIKWHAQRHKVGDLDNEEGTRLNDYAATMKELDRDSTRRKRASRKAGNTANGADFDA